jgi:hypothetical protein
MVERDIETMEEWLPEIYKINENAEYASAKILGTLQLIQQNAINLGDTSPNPSARVGALRAATETLDKEIGFRLKVGQIKSVADKQEDIPVESIDADVSRFIYLIMRLGMEAEDGKPHTDDAASNNAKSVDPKGPQP